VTVLIVKYRAQSPPPLGPVGAQTHGGPVEPDGLFQALLFPRLVRLFGNLGKTPRRGGRRSLLSLSKKEESQHRDHGVFFGAEGATAWAPGSVACLSALSLRTMAASRSPSALRLRR